MKIAWFNASYTNQHRCRSVQVYRSGCRFSVRQDETVSISTSAPTQSDGSELFGPSTGHGFQELIEYDLNQNQWIDENDAIYDELVVWENDSSGQTQLTSLKDADIGAIYLVSQNTPFDFRDEKNQLRAKVQRSGIALHEDGRPMLIQEVDWAV